MKTPIITAILLAVTLAGCTDDTPLAPQGAPTTDKGVIAGLLVDDRFRPIMLTDAPQTAFQASGFVLIQETGEQLTTNENGEFASPPLDPGTYALRFEIDGHEAVPQTVDVHAGEVTELTVVARRTASNAETIIQQEEAVFLACHVSTGVATSTGFGAFDCTGDRSGDTARGSFVMDFSGYAETTHMLAEVILNKNAGGTLEGTYNFQIADKTAYVDNAGQSTDYNYALKRLDSGPYDNVLFTLNADPPVFDYDELLLQSKPWDNAEPIIFNLYFNGQFTDVTDVVGTPQGVGPALGTKGQILVTLFLNTDDATAQSTCFLCT